MMNTAYVDGTLPGTKPILSVEEVTVRFGGLTAIAGASFELEPGKITALIGPNGAGKSTMLNVVSGFIQPDEGRVLFKNADITNIKPYAGPAAGFSRTFQDLEVVERLTVCENVIVAFLGQIGERLSRVVFTPRAWHRERRRHLERALDLLEVVGLSEQADTLASDLAYGMQKQLVLARLLATDAELLMIDEPGAGLPATSLDLVGGILSDVVAERGKTVLLVDHNMQLVLKYAQRIIVLHHGRVIATGTPDEIRSNADVIRVYLSRDPSVADVGTDAAKG